MDAIDQMGILRRIYGDRLLRHADLREASEAHRQQHGEGCSVHPSGLDSGPLWPLLTAMVGARRYLEVGCGLGYTAALMASAGGPACRVDTIEAVPEHADLAEAELTRRGLQDRVRVLRGQARDVLPALEQPYDIVFVDAGWWEYPVFLPHLARLTRPVGVLVTANLFPLFEEWAREFSGKEQLEEYLTRLVRDERFRTWIIWGDWRALSVRLPT